METGAIYGGFRKFRDGPAGSPIKSVCKRSKKNIKPDAVPPTNARSLSLASALAQMGPPFDAGKVASLKAAIASGSYQINLGAIADGIVRFGLNDQA